MSASISTRNGKMPAALDPVVANKENNVIRFDTIDE